MLELALASALLVALASPAADVDPDVEASAAAMVDGEAVTVGAVAARARRAGVSAVAALDAEITAALQARAARAAGLAARPEVAVPLLAERRRLAGQLLAEEAIPPAPPATAAELRRALHVERDRVDLCLVVAPDAGAAQALAARLRSGASLVDEARASPDPQVRAHAGVLGWVRRAELSPPVARLAFAAPLQAPAGPVAVPAGFAVVVVRGRELAAEEALAEAEPELRAAAARAWHEAALARYVDALRAGRPARDGDQQELLADEALRRGLDRDPRVARPLARRERELLAAAWASGPGRAGGAAAAADLRRAARVVIDERALAEATAELP